MLGRSVPDLIRETIAIASRGLVRRGEPTPDVWFTPLFQRLADGASPAERRLGEIRRGGVEEMMRNVRI